MPHKSTRVSSGSRSKTFEFCNGRIVVTQEYSLLTDANKSEAFQQGQVVPTLYSAVGMIQTSKSNIDGMEFDLARFFPGCSGTSRVTRMDISDDWVEPNHSPRVIAEFTCTGPVTINGKPAEELFSA